MLALPIDYNAIRRALVAAVSCGTGLDAGFVIMLQPETDTAPRPPRPYVGIMVTSASIKGGTDSVIPQPDDAGASQSLYLYTGPRTMSVSFEAFGRTHEEAYGVMGALQSAFDQPPVLDILSLAGLGVYNIGASTDMSSLLNTVYEGRAQMSVTFGMTANSLVDLGRMDTAVATGQVLMDANAPIDVSLTLGTEP